MVRKFGMGNFGPELYRKIRKISPWAYIFPGPFLRSLFLEGLIFGGAYLGREIWRFKIDWDLPFLLCFTFYLRTNF